jgi:hypothetical protein
MLSRSRVVALILVVVAHLGVSAAARADETPPVGLIDHEHEDARWDEAAPRRWYGGAILLANAGGVGLSVGCAEWAKSLGCVAPLLAAGPAVHLAHGNPGRAALSLAAHIALPAIGTMLGNAATTSCETSMTNFDGGTITTTRCGSSNAGLTTGVLVGLAAAVALDMALAYDDRRPPQKETAPRRPVARTHVLPTMAFGSSAAVVGLQAQF